MSISNLDRARGLRLDSYAMTHSPKLRPLLFFTFTFAFMCLMAVCVAQPLSRTPPAVDRYYIRVSACDDGGKAYINGKLVVNVGFDEDSNWLDITEDLVRSRNSVRFEVKNRTGAITYLFQVKRNDSVIYQESCGTVKILGCENNRAFRVGIPRSFTFPIRLRNAARTS